MATSQDWTLSSFHFHALRYTIFQSQKFEYLVIAGKNFHPKLINLRNLFCVSFTFRARKNLHIQLFKGGMISSSASTNCRAKLTFVTNEHEIKDFSLAICVISTAHFSPSDSITCKTMVIDDIFSLLMSFSFSSYSSFLMTFHFFAPRMKSPWRSGKSFHQRNQFHAAKAARISFSFPFKL